MDHLSELNFTRSHINGQEHLMANGLSDIEINPIVHHSAKLSLWKNIQTKQTTDEELTSWRHRFPDRFISFNLGDVEIIAHKIDGDSAKKIWLPTDCRRSVFDAYHNLSHPNVDGTRTLLQELFFWPTIGRDIDDWVEACRPCELSKSFRDAHSEFGCFELPSTRFKFIHVDLIVLPEVRGFCYCMTIIDRHTRWLEVIPLSSRDAETITYAFLLQWVTRFGVPACIVVDDDANFITSTFQESLKYLGVNVRNVIEFNSKCNRQVARIYHELEDALCAYREKPDWLTALPLVLISMRSRYRDSIKASVVQVTFGNNTQLPADLRGGFEISDEPPTMAISQKLHRVLNSLRSQPTGEQHPLAYAQEALNTCKPVCVRVDEIQSTMKPNYIGSYPIVERDPNFFFSDYNGNQKAISVDHLKPALEVRCWTSDTAAADNKLVPNLMSHVPSTST